MQQRNETRNKMRIIKEFLKLESSAGILLIFATVVAIIGANGYFSIYYDKFLNTNIAIVIGKFAIEKPMLLWINDGLMAIFFFLVGLELKRELLKGHLSKLDNVILPAIGALGGIIVPALIFYAFNSHDAVAIKGWAIPAATDIAFALGILSLTSKKVPTWATLFLLTLAIFDDLVAIIIIAIFYTDNISINALIFATIAILVLSLIHQSKTKTNIPYIVVGIILWVCVLKSGVHATLAGVITAMFIPINKRTEELEHNLHPWVAFGILPLFAFANTGINLSAITIDSITHSLTLGTGLGLFFGKQLGIFIFCAIPIILNIINLPKGANYKSLYGISVLSGIGFTMSLFISVLAFGDNELSYLLKARTGILLGSIFSCVLGYLILKKCFNNRLTKK